MILFFNIQQIDDFGYSRWNVQFLALIYKKILIGVGKMVGRWNNNILEAKFSINYIVLNLWDGVLTSKILSLKIKRNNAKMTH